MWRESAFTKDMDECGRPAEGRTRDTSPLSPTSAAASTEGLKRQQSRSDLTERLRRKGDKKIHEWLKTISLSVTKHKTSPYRTPKESYCSRRLLGNGFIGPASLRSDYGNSLVCGGRRGKKLWCLWSLLIELQVLPSDSSWCRVKTATKPSLSCNI